MSFLFSRRVKRELEAALLVEFSSVRMLVFERLQEGSVRIFYSEDKSLPRHSADITARQRATLTASATYQLFHDFESSFRKKGYENASIRNTTFFYAPPLAKHSNERVIMKNSETKATLTEQDLGAVFAEAEKQSLTLLKEISKKSGSSYEKHEVIDRKISEINLDGYPVSDFLLKPYTEFSALVSLSAVPEHLTEKLADACHAVFRKSHISHKSSVLAILETLRLLRLVPERFLCSAVFSSHSTLMYVGSEHQSDLALFDCGSKYLSSSLSKRLSSSKTVVESYASLYENGKLHGESQTHFIDAIKGPGQEWLAGALKARHDITKLFMLPKTLYIVPSGRIDSIILAAVPVKTGDQQDLEPHLISRDSFGAVEVSDHVIAGVMDIILVISALPTK